MGCKRAGGAHIVYRWTGVDRKLLGGGGGCTDGVDEMGRRLSKGKSLLHSGMVGKRESLF